MAKMKRTYSPKQYVMFDKKEWDAFVRQIQYEPDAFLRFNDTANPIVETEVQGYPAEITYIKNVSLFVDRSDC